MGSSPTTMKSRQHDRRWRRSIRSLGKPFGRRSSKSQLLLAEPQSRVARAWTPSDGCRREASRLWGPPSSNGQSPLDTAGGSMGSDISEITVQEVPLVKGSAGSVPDNALVVGADLPCTSTSGLTRRQLLGSAVVI